MLSLRSATGVECSYAMPGDRLTFTAIGGSSGSAITVTPSPSTCPWAAIFDEDWVGIDEPSIRVGAGPLSITVGPNPTTSTRDALGYVGNVQDFHVEQLGDHQCTTMSVSPILFPNVDANGASLLAGVRFAPGLGNGCGWWAESLDPEMMELVLPSSNPDGDGDITIQVFGNGVPTPRTGTVFVYKPGYEKAFTISVAQCGSTGNCSGTGEPPPPPGSWSLPSANGLDPGGTRLFVHTDALGSVRMLTDDSQTEVARYDYQPFGQDWQTTGPQAAANKVRFAGGERETDVVFGGWRPLDYFGARYYQGQTGRFTAPDLPGIDQDPLNPQSFNLYAYVRNNPFRYIDPTGRYTCSIRLSGDDAAAAGVADGGSVMGECVDAEDPWKLAQRFFLDSLFGWLTPQVADFSAGLGDALLLGTGSYFRRQLDIDVVDQCSSAYSAGGWSSFAFGAARIGYAGLAKGASMIATSGAEASVYRQGLKTAFRLGVGKNWRAPNLANKTDAQLRASAGKTNWKINLYGGGIAAAGGAEGLGIGCGQ